MASLAHRPLIQPRAGAVEESIFLRSSHGRWWPGELGTLDLVWLGSGGVAIGGSRGQQAWGLRGRPSLRKGPTLVTLV